MRAARLPGHRTAPAWICFRMEGATVLEWRGHSLAAAQSLCSPPIGCPAMMLTLKAVTSRPLSKAFLSAASTCQTATLSLVPSSTTSSPGSIASSVMHGA